MKCEGERGYIVVKPNPENFDRMSSFFPVVCTQLLQLLQTLLNNGMAACKYDKALNFIADVMSKGGGQGGWEAHGFPQLNNSLKAALVNQACCTAQEVSDFS